MVIDSNEKYIFTQFSLQSMNDPRAKKKTKLSRYRCLCEIKIYNEQVFYFRWRLVVCRFVFPVRVKYASGSHHRV